MDGMDELRSPSLPTSPAAPVIVFPSPSMLSVLQLLGTIRCPKKPRAAQLQVLVRDNNVDQALRVLKKKMQREGILREMRLRKASPSLRASGRALVKRGASALA